MGDIPCLEGPTGVCLLLQRGCYALSQCPQMLAVQHRCWLARPSCELGQGRVRGTPCTKGSGPRAVRLGVGRGGRDLGWETQVWEGVTGSGCVVPTPWGWGSRTSGAVSVWEARRAGQIE